MERKETKIYKDDMEIEPRRQIYAKDERREKSEIAWYDDIPAFKRERRRVNRGLKSQNSSLSITNGSNGIIIMDISKRNAYRIKTTSIAMVTISTSNSQEFFSAADVLRRCMAAILSPATLKAM